MERIDVVIAGAGIIGLNIARFILIQDPSLRVRVVEKEKTIGFHASTRNSGVLHSGFYYNKGSLKSRYCVEGNKEWSDLLIKNSLPYQRVGKLIVAKNSKEAQELVRLYENGVSHGIDLKLLSSKQLGDYDELALSNEMFIWSPTTAISDPVSTLNFIAQDFFKMGGEIQTNSIVDIQPKNRILVNGDEISVKHFVNCAGTSAEILAHKFGIGLDYTLVPFLGSYLVADLKELPISKMIYPIPQVGNAFLGVHLTPTTNGKVKLGPTAAPALGPEFYGFGSDLKWSTVGRASKGHYTFAKANFGEFSTLAISELRKKYRKHLLSQAQHLVKADLRRIQWAKSKPGIRAQLVNKRTGNFESDFKVISTPESTHLLNVVSPGWTSALPFAREVAETVLHQINSTER